MKTTQEKDEKILEFFAGYLEENGYPPSIREICSTLKISSTATAHSCINRLIEKGYLSKQSGKKRALSTGWLLEKTLRDNPNGENERNNKNISLVGKITAGVPIEARENIEEVFSMPVDLFGKGDLFMLNVEGDSMIDAGIYNGDIVVIKQQKSVENGDIAAVMIDDAATIKRFYKEHGHFRLQPENRAMQPIFCENVEIIGKVAGLIRKMK